MPEFAAGVEATAGVSIGKGSHHGCLPQYTENGNPPYDQVTRGRWTDKSKLSDILCELAVPAPEQQAYLQKLGVDADLLLMRPLRHVGRPRRLRALTDD